ncbi:hypothetical protein Gotur_026552 [Gossypium turneri]
MARQKIEQVPGVTNSAELLHIEGNIAWHGMAECLTNSLHQVPHLGTPGSGRAKE